GDGATRRRRAREEDLEHGRAEPRGSRPTGLIFAAFPQSTFTKSILPTAEIRFCLIESPKPTAESAGLVVSTHHHRIVGEAGAPRFRSQSLRSKVASYCASCVQIHLGDFS